MKNFKKELTDSKKSVKIKMSKERLKGDDMENKLTYNEALEKAINAVNDEEVKEKLITLQNQLAKKAENRKPRVNKEKIELAEKAIEVMESEHGYRVSELAKMLDVSTQKLTPALTLAVNEGKIEKRIEKRVAFYFAN